MDKKLDILWSGHDFKERNYYLPSDPHIIRMTYGEAELLQEYVQKSQEGILEIGRFFGGSTYFLVESAPKNIMVTSIDIKDRIKIYNNVNEVKHSVKEMRETYAGSKYKSVVKGLKQAQSDGKLSLINKDSSKMKLGDEKKYDVIFIDGDHSYECVMNDLKLVFRPSTKYIVLHDYFEQGYNFHGKTKNSSFIPKKYGVKTAVDHFIEKGRCKKLEQEETMIVLEYLG